MQIWDLDPVDNPINIIHDDWNNSTHYLGLVSLGLACFSKFVLYLRGFEDLCGYWEPLQAEKDGEKIFRRDKKEKLNITIVLLLMKRWERLVWIDLFIVKREMINVEGMKKDRGNQKVILVVKMTY